MEIGRNLRTKLSYTLMAFSLFATRAVCADNNVVVVLDDSGSMRQPMANGERRIDAAKQALSAVLSQLPADTRVGVLTLNTRLAGDPWIVPMGPIDASNWRNRIAAIRPEGGTMLGKFSKVAADELLKLRSADRYGTYRLLIVTDGEATDPAVLSSFLPDILARGLTLDVIGVSMASEHSLASLAHSYRSADDAESLTVAISEVFAETAGDNQSTQSDFELLQGLEDGVAEEVLKSLAVVNNDPIKEVELTVEQGSAKFQLPTSPAPTSPEQVKGGGIAGGLMVCCGSMVIFLVVAVNIFRAVFGKGNKQSR